MKEESETLKLFSVSPLGILLPMKEIYWHSAPPDFLLPLVDPVRVGNSEDFFIEQPKIREARFTRIRRMESGEWMYVLTYEN